MVLLVLGYFGHRHISTKYHHDTIEVHGYYFTSLYHPTLFFVLYYVTTVTFEEIQKFPNINPVGINPVKEIIDVLKYAYYHKYPVRRSALSYYKNTYPSRIDFGKIQYGGPFTNEQVEDTKTVLRLFVLLASLFGFHLSSDGFSTANYILHKTCPSSLALLYFISNPSLVSNFITLFGIPLFHLLRKFSFIKYFSNMKKRMWIGVLFLFLHECQWYRYRERDEVVNVQGMIEEIYEREFLQHENEEDSSDDQDTILIKSLMNYQTFH